MTTIATTECNTAGQKCCNFWTAASLVIAVVGLAGSLYLSIAMGLKACPLCFYQRSFVMAVAAVLLTGLWARATTPPLLCLLALPLAAAGFGVALFHVYLELAGKLECPPGVLHLGTAPQQSLALFTFLLGALLVGTVSGRKQQIIGRLGCAGAILLGLAMAGASIASAPPLPGAPSQPYSEPLEMCRPPFDAT